jgi:antitoxin (DNA-binding transcriptional repressor) of toxin-antitoxin stability system
MKTVEACQLRKEISDALSMVAYSGERIEIKRHDKPVAALVSVDDLAMLRAIEDRFDVELAKKALREKGAIPWSKAKKSLGLA